jgi:hypothetical protein
MDRKALLAAMKLTAEQKLTAVDVDGWGKVYVRQITVAEVEEQAADTEGQKDKNRIARGVARVLCDEKGDRLLDPANDEDVKLLARQPWPKLREILAAAEEGKAAGN